MNIVSPSLLAADITRLGAEVARVYTAPWLHIDVMDGHFVQNLSFGIPIVEGIRRITDKVLDVHLMLDNPQKYIDAFAQAGADLICIHAEAVGNELPRLARKIRQLGLMAGAALKPGTNPEILTPYLCELDMVLVMTVEPGFGGQSFIMDMLPKIQYIKMRANEQGIPLNIQVDGGIDEVTAALCVKAGANVLVAGSYIFTAEDPINAIATLVGS